MGERDFYYSTDGPRSGDSIDPRIADQLRGFVPEAKGPHIDVPESPAGGGPSEVATKRDVSKDGLSLDDSPLFTTDKPNSPEAARQRSADLLTEAMLDPQTDPEAVMAQAAQSGFIKSRDGVVTPRGVPGEQVLDAYEDKKSEVGETAAPSTSSAESGAPSTGQLRSELHNLEQQIASAKSSLDAAMRDGGESYVYERIKSLESRQAEVIAAIEAAKSKETKAGEVKTEETVPPVEPEVAPTKPITREEILLQGLSDGLIRMDDKGRYAASTAEGEAILREAYALEETPKDSEGGADAEQPEEVDAPAEREEEEMVETPEGDMEEGIESVAERGNEGKRERVVERERTIESRARTSPVFREIEARIHEKEKVQAPPKKGILSQAYLWVMRRSELDAYREGKESYRLAQRELKRLNGLRESWITRESRLFDRGVEVAARVATISERIAGGEATKREQREVQKQLAKLAITRESIDVAFAQEIASELGLENFQPVIRPSWEPVDRRPLTGEERASRDTGEVPRFDFVAAEEEIKGKITEELVAELSPEALQGGRERDGLAGILEKLHLGGGEVRSLRDLSPAAQERFLLEEAPVSLASLASSRAMTAALQEEIARITGEGGSPENPLELHQIYTALRASKLSERQAEAQVRNAIDRVSKAESLEELKSKAIEKIKREVGNRVFLVKGGLEITAETRLSEIALSGSGALSEAVYRGWQDWNALRIIGHRTAHGAVNIRRAFNERFSALIPESNNAAIRAAELTVTLAKIDAKREDISEATDAIIEIKNQALERRHEILEDAIVERDRLTAEQRQKVVDGIVEGMIDMLDVPKQSKDKLRRSYQAEGLDDGFLDLLMEYYQRSRLNLERKRLKKEAELGDLEDRRQHLYSMLDRAAESVSEVSVEEIEDELAAIEHEISEKSLSIQDRQDAIWRDYRSQIRNLEGEISEELYQAILDQMS